MTPRPAHGAIQLTRRRDGSVAMCMNVLQVSSQTHWQRDIQIGRLQIINRQAGIKLNNEAEREDIHSGQKHDNPTPNELQSNTTTINRLIALYDNYHANEHDVLLL